MDDHVSIRPAIEQWKRVLRHRIDPAEPSG
jgi:hypothetical protein